MPNFSESLIYQDAPSDEEEEVKQQILNRAVSSYDSLLKKLNFGIEHEEGRKEILNSIRNEDASVSYFSVRIPFVCIVHKFKPIDFLDTDFIKYGSSLFEGNDKFIRASKVILKCVEDTDTKNLINNWIEDVQNKRMDDHQAMKAVIVKNNSLFMELNSSILTEYKNKMQREDTEALAEFFENSKRFVRLFKDISNANRKSWEGDRTFYAIVKSHYLQDIEQDTDVQVVNFWMFSQDQDLAKRFWEQEGNEEQKSPGHWIHDDYPYHDKMGGGECLLKVSIPEDCRNVGFYTDNSYSRPGMIEKKQNTYVVVPPYTFFRLEGICENYCDNINENYHKVYHMVVCKDNKLFNEIYSAGDCNHNGGNNQDAFNRKMVDLDELFFVPISSCGSALESSIEYEGTSSVQRRMNLN